LRGVILTDVFQSIVIFGSMVTVFAYGSSEAGGLGNVFKMCAEFNRTNFLEYVSESQANCT
jgi:Na+/proline symporter